MLGQMLPFLVYVSREDFFKRIASFFAVNSFEYREITCAHDFVEKIFEGDFREDDSPYVEHLRGTALIVLCWDTVSYHVVVAALLHDVVENHPEKCSLKRIKKEFGARVAFLVKYVTKPTESEYSTKEERDHVYHCRFCFATIETILLKLADRLHNVLTLGACPPDKRQRTIRDTWRYYMPFAEEWGILYEELKEALIKAEKMK